MIYKLKAIITKIRNERIYMFSDWVVFYVLLYIIFVFFKFLSYAIFKKKNNDNPFERGITSNKSSRKPYSLSFFMITLIFLLFDIEIILLIPFVIFAVPSIMIDICLFIYLLFLGLILEWNIQSLEWKN